MVHRDLGRYSGLVVKAQDFHAEDCGFDSQLGSRLENCLFSPSSKWVPAVMQGLKFYIEASSIYYLVILFL